MTGSNQGDRDQGEIVSAPAGESSGSAAPLPELFTLGHSNHPLDHLLELLRRHGIEAVADVRTSPFSRFVPHFNRAALARALPERGVSYCFLGRELGGKPPRQDPPATRPAYGLRIRDPAFQAGIGQLLALAARSRTALLCRERDPLDCHRLHLICRYVKPFAGPIRHILPDGAIEPQPDTERRLLARAGIAPLPLFGAAGEPDPVSLEQAYERCALR